MSNISLILCEGKRDANFLEKVLKKKFTITPITENEQKKVERLLRKVGERGICILFPVGGKIKAYKSIKNLISKLRSVENFINIGFFVDENREQVFNRLLNELKHFIQTPCKFHPVQPTIQEDFRSERIVIDFKKGTKIIVHSYAIPESLETQLKRKFYGEIPEEYDITVFEDTD